MAASKISSLGFSGAGFLACYHSGVAKCLLDQGIILGKGAIRRTTPPPLPLIGVSAGALISAAIAAGVDPDEGMNAVLEVNRQTRQAGRLDALQPGYSLIDVAEEHFSTLLRRAVEDDPNYFLERIEHGRLLHIGLTDRRVFPPVGQNNASRAFAYVDRYRDIDDVIAACTLSCYIPGLTGPAWGALDGRHGAILRAAERLKDMIRIGAVKKGSTGEPLQASAENEDDAREICWDGGLVNAFPFIDSQTVIVTPVAATFVPNDSINPGREYDAGSIRQLQVTPHLSIHMTAANAATLRSMMFSSEDAVLQEKFAEGFDNTHSFLSRHNLLSVFHSSPTTTSSVAD